MTNKVTAGDILKFIAAIVLPPLAVFLQKDACDRDFLINCLLTLIAWLPGVVHALYIVVKNRRTGALQTPLV